MKGPSRAVAREFVEADKKYSGGFAENRYWTGGLAAMNEINSGVPQTLNFQEGGTVYVDYYGNEPRVMDLGDFKEIVQIGPMEAEGWTWDATTSTMYPPLWNIESGGFEETILQPTTTTATAPATTGIGTPYVGAAWNWGGYGDYDTWRQNMIDQGIIDSEPEPAPVRDIPGAGTLEPITGGTGAGESTGSQWTPEQIAAWNAQQTTSDRQSPYRDQLREHKARIAATLGTGNATGGRVAMDELHLAMGGRGGRRRAGRGRRGGGGGGGGTITPAPPTVRDIPGAAPQPGATGGTGSTGGSGSITGAVFGAAKQLFQAGQSQWTPAQIEAWNAKEKAKERQSPYRDRLRAHKARTADLLKPGPLPSNTLAPRAPGGNIGGGPSPPYMPPVYGDKPEPGMAYIGGTPGFYAPGGPGYGGGSLSGGGYGYEGDPSQPGYDDRSYEEFAAAQRNTAPDITDEVLKARYEGRNANQGVIYTSGIGVAKGGYMNYQEGGAASRTPVEGGGAPIAGHQEGTNPFDFATHPSSYRNWENKYHYDPPPPPPPPEPEEEPGWWESLFGAPEVEKLKTRTERELEAMGEARGGYMRGYRGGGPVRRYQGGGLAQVSAPRGGVPPWVEPAGYMEPEGYQAGGTASLFGGRPPQSVASQGPGAGRWSGAQQQQWRNAGNRPGGRARLQKAYQSYTPEQRAGYSGRVGYAPQAPQQAAQAGMMGDAQRQQAALQQRAGMAGAQADYQQGLAAQRGARPAVMPGGGQMVGGGQGLTGPWQGDPANNPMRPRGPLAPGGRPLQLPGRGGPGRWTPQQQQAWRGARGNPALRSAMGQQNQQRQALGRQPGGGGIMGGAKVPPNMRGMLQKQRMMNRPPSNVGGGVNRVGQQDQQGALSRAMQRGTGRRPMSRRGGFPGGGMR